MSQPDPLPDTGEKEVTGERLPGDDKTAHKNKKTKNNPRDGILRLGLIVAMNGQNLTRTIASLTKRRGKRPAYAESTFEEFSEVVKELLADPRKGALRLRTLLGLGLQQGAKCPSMDAFWTELLHLVDSFLRGVSFPRTIAIEGGASPITPTAYRELWDTITSPDEDNATKGTKELLAAQEVVILDVIFAHWKERLSSDDVVQAISFLELPEQANDSFHRSLPWTPTASLVTGLDGSVVVAQAGAVHGELGKLQRLQRDATQRVAQLEKELAATTQELAETHAALAEESDLLHSANDTIAQLRHDVQAAGAIHRHRGDELRSRYKGFLEGDLDRHLETIQRAADMTPPRGSVIIERVETLLETLKRELKWLDDSE